MSGAPVPPPVGILPPIRCIFPFPPRPPGDPSPGIPEVKGAGPPYYVWRRVDLRNLPRGVVESGSTKAEIVRSLFIGRARHGFNQLPAEVDPPLALASVAWNHTEHLKSYHEFQMLLVLRGTVEWVPARDGDVPPFALPVGRMADGEMVYAGRVSYDRGVTATAGRVVKSEGACFIPHNGRELVFSEYEVLTLS